MIEDIIYDETIFIYETPNEPSGGGIFAVSYDGNDYVVSETQESVTIFIS
jgi:hypothetical protein